MTEFDETKPLSAAMEGLQALKYESDSNDDNALSYKEDGNRNFERKKYRWAVDSYTAGIRCKSADRNLNAILYTNRAAGSYHIGNYLSAFNDCVIARKFKPDHMKAITRGVQCSLQRKKYETAISWCDDGLAISADDVKLLEMRSKADQLLRHEKKEERKRLLKQKKEEKVERQLLEAIKQRNIRLEQERANGDGEGAELDVDLLESCHPSRARVTLDADGVLHWPVMFLYPEFGETDFVTSFCENSRFIDHLCAMFCPSVEPPTWDPERRYTTDSTEIYFEERDEKKLHRVSTASTLKETLQDSRFIIASGTPNFFLLVKNSDFAKNFLARHS